MKKVITFLLGIAAGVVVMVCTMTLRASQRMMLYMFAAGVVLGMAAAVMCMAHPSEDDEKTKEK
jgi:peptidoglycan/LPS O-acetylase OafA/YrhL